jgi:hypothetical protein
LKPADVLSSFNAYAFPAAANVFPISVTIETNSFKIVTAPADLPFNQFTNKYIDSNAGPESVNAESSPASTPDDTNPADRVAITPGRPDIPAGAHPCTHDTKSSTSATNTSHACKHPCAVE